MKVLSPSEENHIKNCKLPFDDCLRCQEIESLSAQDEMADAEMDQYNNDSRINRITHQKAWGQ